MRVASFEIDGRRSYGVVRGEEVFEAKPEWRRRYRDLGEVLAAGVLADVPPNCESSGREVSELHFLPVIPRPDKILCVGVNYRPHVIEMGRDVPEKPVVFVRFAGSLTGHGQPIIRPRVSEQYDFEGELAVVIGRRARHLSREQALDHVAGYTGFMDGSVRDWQRHTPQFTPGKNFEKSGSMGPWLVSADEIDDVDGIQLETRVNGAVMQQGRVAELIFDIPYLLEYCSTFTELLPGDVIATGTPGGVGAARQPPVWLRAGDEVVVDIGGIGQLRNPVDDE